MPISTRIVSECCHRARLVIAACVALTTLATIFIVQHFAMSTETLDLISADLPWRRNMAAFDNAFPQRSDLMIVVVDGATPELAEKATTELAASLSHTRGLFRSVRRPDGGGFFARNGLLLQPLSDVEAATKQLIGAQSFLGPLSADPSLRGIMTSLSAALTGVREGATTLVDLGPPMRAIADAIEHIVQGQPAFFSWRTLISPGADTRRERRRLILVQPALDLGALAPGARASDAIRRIAGDLHLDPRNGARVRLTGQVPLADEEFASFTEHAVPMAVATVIAVLFMLWLGVRSLVATACIVASTVSGLLLTTALGLLLLGRFNLISVAFVPVFVGLGVDFSIQFSMRYRAEQPLHQHPKDALEATGRMVGRSLALAAAALAAGFFAFLPTAYLGASELGMIAGTGMGLAYLLSITLLPALLTVANLKPPRGAIGLTLPARLRRFLADRRGVALAVAGAAAVGSIALLPFLRFDFNPLHLKNAHVESVSTLADLMSDPNRTPNTIDVLTPSLAAADELAARLSRLPEVDSAITLSNFVPEHQSEKLAIIEDAATLLDLTLDPLDNLPPPTDEEVSRSLRQTSGELRQTAATSPDPGSADALRLATVLSELSDGNPALRARASNALIVPLTVMFGQIRAALHPEMISLQSLPTELVQDWVTKDGRARIQVFPKGDSNDNEILRRFSNAVLGLAPDATGAPIASQAAARVIVNAFIQAGIASFVVITALLAIALRRGRDVLLTLAPILLTGLLTLATCILIGQPLNFANIIALPLLFGIGVAFNIYFVIAWRQGTRLLLESNLIRAILCSALTTAAAFAGLCFSTHPGTASIGELFTISLAWTLAVTILFQPALLGAISLPVETQARRLQPNKEKTDAQR